MFRRAKGKAQYCLATFSTRARQHMQRQSASSQHGTSIFQAPLSVKALPYVPPLVDLADIDDNGRLVSPEKLAEAIDKIATHAQRCGIEPHKDMRYKKNTLLPYGVIRHADDYFVLYKGAKHKRLVGSGAFGRIKLMQNANTAEWDIYKIQVINDLSKPATIQVRNMRNIEITKRQIEAEYSKSEILGVGALKQQTHKSDKKKELQYNFGMKLVHGISLDRLRDMPAYQHKPAAFWLRLFIEILLTTHELHVKHRKLHLDLKPANYVYNTVTRKIELVDFGFTENMDINNEFTGYARGSVIYTDYDSRKIIKESVTNKKQCDSTTFNTATELFSVAITITDIIKLLSIPGSFDNFNPDISYIQQSGSKLFETNNIITDKALRQRIVEYLNKMTAHDPVSRPSTTEAIDYFKNLYQVEIKQNGQQEMVTSIHMDEWAALTKTEQQATIKQLAANPAIYKIYLIDSKDKGNRTYFEIRRDMEEAGLTVDHNILINQNKQLLLYQAEKYISKHESDELQHPVYKHYKTDYDCQDNYELTSPLTDTPAKRCVML